MTLRKASYMAMGGDSQAQGVATPSFISSPRTASVNMSRYFLPKEQKSTQEIKTIARHCISPLGMAILLRPNFLLREVQTLMQNQKIIAHHCILLVRRAIILRQSCSSIKTPTRGRKTKTKGPRCVVRPE